MKLSLYLCPSQLKILNIQYINRFKGENYEIGGGSMSQLKNGYHRFSLHEENVGFTTNDGVNIFIAGTRFQKCITGGHTELPVDSSEMIEANQIEKRNNLFAPKNMYITLMNL